MGKGRDGRSKVKKEEERVKSQMSRPNRPNAIRMLPIGVLGRFFLWFFFYLCFLFGRGGPWALGLVGHVIPPQWEVRPGALTPLRHRGPPTTVPPGVPRLQPCLGLPAPHPPLGLLGKIDVYLLLLCTWYLRSDVDGVGSLSL